MEEQKHQALTRRSAFCAASDQSLDFLLHVRASEEKFSCFLHNLKMIEYKNMEKIDQMEHCLFLHQAGFLRLRHKYRNEIMSL